MRCFSFKVFGVWEKWDLCKNEIKLSVGARTSSCSFLPFPCSSACLRLCISSGIECNEFALCCGRVICC